MSIVPSPAPISSPTPRVEQARTRLWITVIAHAVVDFFSFTAPPLLTVLEGRLTLTPEQGALLLGVGALCNGLVQPIVAWLSDRFNTRLFGWLGLVLAVLGVGCIGFADSYWQLLLIQIVSGLGIGAFHPIAAAAVGQLSGSRRSFGVAIFYSAGMIGGITGNIGAPLWVGHFDSASTEAGLRALAWFIPPGLFTGVLLYWAIRRIPHRRHDAHESHATLSPAERAQRWRAVAVLYLGNLLRFAVDAALILLITRWCEHLVLSRPDAVSLVLDDAARQQAAELSGPMQAAKQLGMGLCGLVAGWYVSARYERLALAASPLLAAVAIGAMPHASGSLFLLLSLIAGVGYGGLVPLTISLAQRLLPHRTSLASGLMMGGAWSLSSFGAIAAQRIVDQNGLQSAFHVTAAVCVVAAASSLLLPGRLLRSVGAR